MNAPHGTLPVTIPLGLLEHAKKMRTRIEQLFCAKHFTPHMKLVLYYENMRGCVEHGDLTAVDLTVDIAYLTPEDPRLPGLVTLDPDALAARTRDMIAMRSRHLN